MGLMDKVGNFLQGDFVKNGVREMMIARPEDNNDLVFKWPDKTIPMFAQCTVRGDEWAVFSKEGRPVGTLDAGRATLSTANIPFLSNFVDQYTGGNFLMTELFFVKRTPYPRKFGGSLGNMIDPMTQIRLRGRCHGELLLKVVNPEALVYQYFGMRKFQDHPDIFDWYINAFFNTLKSTIGRLAREQRRTLLDVMDLHDEIANALTANTSDLAQTGIQIAKVTQLEIDVPEEDVKRFDEMRQKVAEQLVGVQMDEIAIQRAALQAQAQAAAAQVGVSTAQYAAQARQFELDQRRQQDAAYVQMAGGNMSQVAQLDMARGAAAGIAQHGLGNAGIAGLAAQAGVGAVVGGTIGGQMVGGGAPGVVPAAGVMVSTGQGANLVACPQCRANVPPGRFCAECGATLAPQSRRCASCSTELKAGAKFCPECGTPAGATPPQAPPQQ